MADKIIKKVVLKDPVTGVYLHPETDITVPTKVSDLTNDAGYITASDVGNGTLTVQKNGTSVGTFTANTSTNKTINITVPTSAADVDALPSSTKYAASMDLSIDSNTYIVTAQLKDQDGIALGDAKTIDLPLESVVVSGSYDDTNKKIILTLQSGSTVDVPVGDLIAGLQTEITSTNKLSADLIADGTTNKVVTASEKSAWNGKQDAIADLDDIRSGASLGATALQSYTETDPIYLADKPSIALKSEIPTVPTNVSAFTNDAGYLTEHQDISNLATKEELTTGLSGKQNNLTASQLNAANSGITADKVIIYDKYETSKQDVITDLDAIRSGASLGATALQSYNETDPVYLADKPKLALKSEIPDISGKLNISTYDIDRAIEKTTETTATNIVNVSITSDLIDDICSQLDAQTTKWSA